MTRFSFESEDNPHPYQAVEAHPSEPPRYQSSPNAPLHPGAHPDSAFSRLRSERRYSNQREAIQPTQNYAQTIRNPPPLPPPHRAAEGRAWGRESGYTNSGISNITPGADNFGEQAQGGMAGLALGVADAHARESGLEAMRHTPGYESRDIPAYEESPYATSPTHRQDISQSSLTPLGAAAFPPGHTKPSLASSVSQFSRSAGSLQDPYSDSVYYNRHSRSMNPDMEFDPNSIEDDGDDGLEYRQQRSQRGSTLNLSQNGDRGATPVGGAAAAGGIMGTLGGLVGRSANGNAPQYDPVGAPQTGYNGPNDYDLGRQEKSEWLRQQKTGTKKVRWIVWTGVIIIIVGAIAGGIVGGILSRKKSSSSSSTTGQSASSDTSSNGDLTQNSTEIKKLMNNPNLHKVFPGIDYTPMNTQYPDCLADPPSQNNVTRDLAVLSQLTNIIRLYGTDCNQTQMLLHSIDNLGLNGTIKVWLGVWQDNNATTNARQLAQMYDILDTYGASSFLGVIVGNEVLYRQDMTATELGTVISGVRTNLTSRGFTDLAVASSDLGDNWSSAPELVTLVDYVMANIHPFFAGVPATEASSWTNTFFNTHDVNLKSNASKSIISETGWPSAGGTDCGTDTVTVCPDGAVAGITEMNTFMDDFVCNALNNGTNFFWFEAFDEPWKIVYDTAGQDWEDKWGLMDVNRNLKSGVTIPNCGGKTVGAASL